MPEASYPRAKGYRVKPNRKLLRGIENSSYKQGGGLRIRFRLHELWLGDAMRWALFLWTAYKYSSTSERWGQADRTSGGCWDSWYGEIKTAIKKPKILPLYTSEKRYISSIFIKVKFFFASKVIMSPVFILRSPNVCNCKNHTIRACFFNECKNTATKRCVGLQYLLDSGEKRSRHERQSGIVQSVAATTYKGTWAS